MDALSDILSLLRPRTAASAGLAAGGDWAIQFPGHEGIKFNAVMRGACWVQIHGEEEMHRIEAGDCFLLTRGKPFLFATDLSLPPIDSSEIYDRAVDGIATCNGGGDFFLVGGRFSFEGEHPGLLFDSLPPVVKVREATDQAAVLRWALDQLAAELKTVEQGAVLMAEHLAQIMLLQVLRLWLSAEGSSSPGWLGGLADRRLAKAIGAIHLEPERRWKLADLAAVAGMSRTSFAERFRARVGQSPVDYLYRWRMQLAASRLRRSSDTVAGIAFSLGYESEAAFNTAFRRAWGCSPGRYRRDGEKG